MTTFDPGASVVFTHGLRCNPRSTAFFASSAAAIITDGFDVFVHEVMAAITTAPWSSSNSVPSSSTTATCLWPGSFAVPLGRPLAEWSKPIAGGSEAGNDSATVSSSVVRTDGLRFPLVNSPSDPRNADLASDSGTRSCGRRGPAIDGTTLPRSSSRYSE